MFTNLNENPPTYIKLNEFSLYTDYLNGEKKYFIYLYK